MPSWDGWVFIIGIIIYLIYRKAKREIKEELRQEARLRHHPIHKAQKIDPKNDRELDTNRFRRVYHVPNITLIQRLYRWWRRRHGKQR